MTIITRRWMLLDIIIAFILIGIISFLLEVSASEALAILLTILTPVLLVMFSLILAQTILKKDKWPFARTETALAIITLLGGIIIIVIEWW